MDYAILHFLNGRGDLFWDEFVRTITFGWTWLPLYIILAILIIKNNKTVPQILLIFACGLFGVLLAGGVSDMIVKPMTERLRPCDDPLIKESLHIVKNLNVTGFSFYSSHAANTFSLAMFFTLLTRSGLLSFTLFSWATLNAWSRLYLAAHYPSDVAVGMLWGTIVGIIVYVIYHKVFNRISNPGRFISTKYTRTGYAFTDIDMCMAIVVFTVIYAILKSLVLS